MKPSLIKNTVYLLIISLLILGCNHELTYVPTESKLEPLYGKIKILNETTFRVIKKEGDIKKGRVVKGSFFYILYDKEGNIIKDNYYTNGRSSKPKDIRNYDNKVKLDSVYEYKSNNNLDNNYIFKYDDRGNNIEGIWYKSDGSLDDRYTYKYDDKGNKVEYKEYNSDGILEEEYTWKYNDNGNIIEKYRYNFDGKLEKEYTWKYDDNGNLVEFNIYNSDGKLEEYIILEYDDNGNLVEDIWYNSDGSIYKKYTYKFKFDKKNNWIERIEYIDDTPNSIIEREIEYYQ